MVQYIFTIRKQHSVNKVHTLRYSVSKISEYKSRCCVFLLFCYILCHKSWYLVQCKLMHENSQYKVSKITLYCQYLTNKLKSFISTFNAVNSDRQIT